MKGSQIDIYECWSVIEEALCAQAPRLFATLAAPASEAELAALEQIIGLRLPNDLTASLRCHNGQRDPAVYGRLPTEECFFQQPESPRAGGSLIRSIVI